MTATMLPMISHHTIFPKPGVFSYLGYEQLEPHAADSDLKDRTLVLSLVHFRGTLQKSPRIK